MDLITRANFTPLTHAVAIGDDATVHFLLETGSDPNSSDDKGVSALNLALNNRHLLTAGYLMDFGADIEFVDSTGMSPAQTALKLGLGDITGIGRDEIIDDGLPGPRGARSPGRLVRRSKWLSLRTVTLYAVGLAMAIAAYQIKLLFNDRATQSLIDSIYSDDISHLGELLTSGISANTRDSSGNAVLLFAANSGRTEAVRLLLKNHADPNLGMPAGISGLERAGIEHLDIVENLLDSGADPNRKDARGRSLLAYACTSPRYDQISAVLLKHGAKPNVEGENGPPLVSLIEASEGRSIEIVKQLLRLGADANAKDSAQTPVLLWASEHGTTELVTLLLDSGAHVAAKDVLGRTALHVACKRGNVEVVSLLLQRNADANARDSDGNTPMMYAVAGVLEGASGSDVNCRSILRLLMQYHADRAKANRAGQTPASFAESHGLTSLRSSL